MLGFFEKIITIVVMLFKKLVLFILVLVVSSVGLILVNPASSRADSSEYIESFSSQLVLTNNSVTITENILYFFPTPKRGIYRDLVLTESSDLFANSSYDIKVLSVFADDTTVPVSYDFDDSTLRIRIGDPDREVSGFVNYTISYEVFGVLHNDSTNTIFTWNAIGSGWDVPIDYASVVFMANSSTTNNGPNLALPPTKVNCFQGPYGSTSNCIEILKTNSESSFMAEFSAGPLEPNDSVTITSYFDKIPDSLIEEGSREVVSNVGQFDSSLLTTSVFSSLPLFIGYGLAGLAALFFVFSIFYRLVVNRKNNFTDPPVFFEPPLNLSPAELDAARDISDKPMGNLEFAATIFDLATRGYLTIKITSSRKFAGLLTDNDIVLERLPIDSNSNDLKSFELTILNALFKDKTSVVIDGPLVDFASVLKKVGSELSQDLVAKGLRSRNANLVNKLVRNISLAAFGLAAIFGFFGQTTAMGYIIFATIISNFAVHIFPLHRTGKAAELERQTLGFKKFLTTPAALDRVRLASRLGYQPSDMAVTFLPYAVLFGAEKEWLSFFEGFYDHNTALRNGVQGSSGTSVLSTISAVSSGLLAVAPSSSGSSGSSSGSGRGGGGGGSW